QPPDIQTEQDAAEKLPSNCRDSNHRAQNAHRYRLLLLWKEVFDERENLREHHRRQDALKNASSQQEQRVRSDATEQRGDGETSSANQEHPLVTVDITQS